MRQFKTAGIFTIALVCLKDGHIKDKHIILLWDLEDIALPMPCFGLHLCYTFKQYARRYIYWPRCMPKNAIFW